MHRQLKAGSYLVSVPFAFYGVIMAYRATLMGWNTGNFYLILKLKGRRDDVIQYRPIVLGSVFRKVVFKMLLLRTSIIQIKYRKGRRFYG